MVYPTPDPHTRASSGECIGKDAEPLGPRRGAETTVTRNENEVLGAEQEGGGKMERAEAAQVAVDGESGGVFGQGLIDFDDAERRPFLSHGSRCRPPGAEANGAHRVDEPGAADEPASEP